MPQIVNATTTSAAAALPGTVVTATADCPAGEVLLGGGAAATTNQAPDAARFALQSSAPLDADSWRATAIVQLVLVPGQTVSIHATAICTTRGCRPPPRHEARARPQRSPSPWRPSCRSCAR